MVRKGNHPTGRKICKFQICESFLNTWIVYNSSDDDDDAKVLSASAWSLGAPTEHEGWQWGHTRQSSPWYHVWSCRNFYQGHRGLLFFSSEHAAMKKIQDNLMFGGFWPKMLKILPRQIGWVFNSVALVYFWLCLIMAAMADSRPQATKTPFHIFPPKNERS